jgi:transcriptional regulator with XRE-family HTH domain
MINDRGALDTQGLLAANLRRLRIARHLSMSELARATGVSKATLSGIENKRANPTVETLATLAGALRVSMVELLEEAPLGEVRVVRAAQRRSEQGDGVPRQLLEALSLDGSLELAEIAMPAGELHEAKAQSSGSRAHLYVIEGTLIAGPVERASELAAGDYASFPADVPHAYEAVRQPARALLLTSATG